MMRYEYLIAAFLVILIACKGETPSQPVGLEGIDTAVTNIVEVNEPKGDSSKFIPAFVSYIEKIHCDDKYNVSRCYGMHETSVRNDLFQSTPIILNFPYNTEIDWNVISTFEGFEAYWSLKCGYEHVEKKIIVNYPCPNIESEMRVWLDSLAQDNDIVMMFTADYYKSQSVSSDFQKTFILQAVNFLDFNNIDHRAFYWMYYLTLSELIAANQEINLLSKKE